jgi:hypothetical protein
MSAVIAWAMSIASFLAITAIIVFVLRWLILGRMPEGIALLGRDVESLRERVARLEEEASRREETPSS